MKKSELRAIIREELEATALNEGLSKTLDKTIKTLEVAKKQLGNEVAILTVGKPAAYDLLGMATKELYAVLDTLRYLNK